MPLSIMARLSEQNHHEGGGGNDGETTVRKLADDEYENPHRMNRTMKMSNRVNRTQQHSTKNNQRSNEDGDDDEEEEDVDDEEKDEDERFINRAHGAGTAMNHMSSVSPATRSGQSSPLLLPVVSLQASGSSPGMVHGVNVHLDDG